MPMMMIMTLYQDKGLAAKYNVDEFPTLMFFENQIPSEQEDGDDDENDEEDGDDDDNDEVEVEDYKEVDGDANKNDDEDDDGND